MPGAGAAPLVPRPRSSGASAGWLDHWSSLGPRGSSCGRLRSRATWRPVATGATRYPQQVQQGDEGMTVRRVAAEVALIVSVVIVATATGAVLGLRAFNKWMSAPARPNRTL